MNDWASKVWFWRVAIIKMVNGCVKVGLLAFISGTSTRNWSDLSGDGKLLVIISAVLAAQAVVKSFCDSTLHELKGKSDTVFMKK